MKYKSDHKLSKSHEWIVVKMENKMFLHGIVGVGGNPGS